MKTWDLVIVGGGPYWDCLWIGKQKRDDHIILEKGLYRYFTDTLSLIKHCNSFISEKIGSG